MTALSGRWATLWSHEDFKSSRYDAMAVGIYEACPENKDTKVFKHVQHF